MFLINLWLIDNEKVEIYGLQPFHRYEFKCVPRVGEKLSLTDDEKDLQTFFEVVSVAYPLEANGTLIDLYVKPLGLYPEFENHLIEKHVDV